VAIMNLTWLPFVVSLLPIATVSVCYGLSASEGLIPSCIPLLEGCTTVSRAGRYGMAYFLFKGGVIPTAVLMMFFWVLCRKWFLSLGSGDSFGLRAMVWLGVVSAIFLIIYSVFLGSEGALYSQMRRFGVIIHFSFAYLAQVLLLNRLWDKRRAKRLGLPNYITTGMFIVTVLMFVVGLYSIPVEEIIPDPDHRIINTIEWNFALLLFGWYLLPALGWRASEFRVRFEVRN
jgi:hypothetical protein